MKRFYGLNRQRIMHICFMITLLTLANNSVAQIETSKETRKKASTDTAFFESNPDTFGPIEQMPEFPGGESALKEYIIQHTKYPIKAVKDSISGRVILRFAIQPDGSITDISIVRGIRQDLDQECIRVITNMPKWKPCLYPKRHIKGYYYEPVKVWYSFPFVFYLGKGPIPNGNFIISPK